MKLQNSVRASMWKCFKTINTYVLLLRAHEVHLSRCKISFLFSFAEKSNRSTKMDFEIVL